MSVNGNGSGARPRVLHVVPALFAREGGIVGGAERYALELARHMAERVPTTLVNKLVWRLANRYPEAYERRWAWVFPAFFLSFELEVVKDDREGGESGR